MTENDNIPVILVVDDHLPTLQGLSRILRTAGYVILEADCGHDCLRLAAERMPDLILLDVVMPDIDGREVCRRIKSDQSLSSIYVVLFSSLEFSSETQAEELESGADGFIVRPFSNRELLARVKALLRLKKTEKELKESRELLSLAIKGSGLALWDWWIETGKTVFNERWAEIIGYTLDELGPTHYSTWVRFVHPDDLKTSENLLQKVFEGKLSHYELEVRMKHKDGHWIWALDRGKVTQWDKNGKPIRMTGTHLDITERKKVEEDIQLKQSYLRAIIENQPGLVWLKDESSRFLTVNTAFALSCGKNNPEELVGLTDFDVWPSDLAQQYRSDDEKVIKSRREYMTEEPVFEKGTITWFETFKMPVINAEGDVIGTTGYARDITERQLTNQALKHRDTLLTQVSLATQVLIIDKDISSAVPRALEIIGKASGHDRVNLFECHVDPQTAENVASLRYQWVKPGIGAQLNNPELQFLSLDRLLPGWFDTLVRNKSISGSVGQFSEAEQSLLRYHGIVSMLVEPVNVDGRLWGFVAFDNCSTEHEWGDSELAILKSLASSLGAALSRGFSEESLRLSREQFALAVHGSNDGIWDWNLRDNSLYLSERWKEQLGYRDDELKNSLETFTNMIHPDDRTRIHEYIDHYLSGGTDKYRIEFRMKHKNGDWRWILARGAAVLDQSGKPVRMAGSHTDITERKQAEEERERLQDQLLQAQKIESVATLAGGVAHEFNNILQVILGYCQLAMDSKDLTEYHKNTLLRISEAGKKAADLVRRLLVFVSHVDIRAVPIDLNKHIIGMKKMFQVSIPRQIGLKILLAENLSWINADPSQLDQILMNLVSNAGDAIEDSGQITIETFNFLVNEEFASSHLKARPGEYVVLKVSDTGSGMEKSVQNRIFEPFFTTREPGKGTGLGLSVIFGAVHELGGFMDFNSEPGLGTTFRVYFPAINTDQIITATEQSEIIKNEIRGVSETVLLVDDDPELIEIGEVVLKDAGYRVLTANDGEEAIDIYRRHSEHISLVILDLIMPTMSGIQCLMELKKIDDSVKVLVASGYSPDNQVAEAMSAGASGFLGKPYIFSHLLQTVREIIERQ